MYGFEILRVIEDIKDTSSPKSKLQILTKNKDLPFLDYVLKYAFSPRKVYFIKDLENLGFETESNETTEIVEVFSLLDKLATGNYRGEVGKELIRALNSTLDNSSKEVFKRIIDRNLKFAMGTTLINKVFPNLIEETPYMGCKPYSKKLADKLFSTSDCVISEVKMDGQYINAIISDNTVRLESRQGETNIFPSAKFIEELKTIDGDWVLNGELTIEGEKDRHTANGILRSLVDIFSKQDVRTEKEHKKHYLKFLNEKGYTPESYLDRIIFTSWDIITEDEYSLALSSKTRLERLEILEGKVDNLESVRVIEYKVVKTLAEAMEHYNEIVQDGGEGTVIKDGNGIWKDGKPVWQLKIKTEMEFDLVIVGFNYGTNKNEGIISSLKVQTSDGLLSTDPGGMPEALMAEITANPEAYLGKIVAMKCYGVSKNRQGEYSSSHPSVNYIREDKTVANTLAECIEINNSLIN